jgi:hypothetical protein
MGKDQGQARGQALAIIDLAQPTRPLTRHADRALPLFREAALVDDQATCRLATQKAVRVLADLGDHRRVIPRRVADEVLELPGTAMINHVGHRGERAILHLREPTEIARRDGGVVARLDAKKTAVAADHRGERVHHAIDQ